MPALPGKPRKPISFRRMLVVHKVSLPIMLPRGRVSNIEVMKVALNQFVAKLQETHPFIFRKAARELEHEQNRWVQEKHGTHFILTLLIDSIEAPPEVKAKALVWAQTMSEKIDKGGENWRTPDLKPEELSLVKEIGHASFSQLYAKADELSLAMKFRSGPVNSAEHTIAWSFRYAGMLLDNARRLSSVRVTS